MSFINDLVSGTELPEGLLGQLGDVVGGAGLKEGGREGGKEGISTDTCMEMAI